MTKSKLETAAVVLTVCCTVLLTGLALRREFGGGSRAFASPRKPPALITALLWDSLANEGHRVKGRVAPLVTLVEFGDFECPACGSFANVTWKALQATFADSVGLVYRHYPLTYHRFAVPFAKAAECAARQGRFAEFYKLVFEQQAALPLKQPWEFAREAGARDSTAFQLCFKETSFPAIERDKALASHAGVDGTPALYLDGARIAIDSASVVDAVAAALQKRRKGLK
jgi:protein-disulfide isomerase